MDQRLVDEITNRLKTPLSEPPPDRLSKGMIDTFHSLVNAYMSGDLSPNLYFEKDDKGRLRVRIASLRKALEGKLFRLPDDRYLEFRIPNRSPYHLMAVDFLNRSLFWADHTQHHEEITVQTYERLFFRHKTFYARDTRVNQIQEVAKVAESTKFTERDLSPSMHYISSGEISGALALQKFFIAECGKRAFVSTDPHAPRGKQNLILLGSARLENPDLYSPKYEKYKVVEGGIRPDCHDKVSEHNRRIVHVLLSRRRGAEASGVQTVLESSHGRATQGVCEQLVQSPRSQLCDAMASAFGLQQQPFPDKFQAIFKVELGYDTAVSQVHGAELVRVEPYRQMAAMR